MDNDELIVLMNKELPSNVIKCLSLAGYDSPEVISQMTTDGPGSSIVVENYILQEHSNDPSCFHLSNINYTHVFTPGHRIRLSNFIQTVRSQCLKRKLTLPNTSNKQKPTSEESNEVTTTHLKLDYPKHNLEWIYDDIRRRSLNWVKTCDRVPDLKEHDDYTITVKLNKLNHPIASIYCALCRKTYKLNEKPNNSGEKIIFMLSNWTAHFDRCKNQRSDNQRSLFRFFTDKQTESSHKHSLSIENKKSVSTTLNVNNPNSSASGTTCGNVADNSCEKHENSEDSSASNCKVISIIEESNKKSEVTSDTNSDERIDSQKDSLLQLNNNQDNDDSTQSISVAKECEADVAIHSIRVLIKMRIFR